MNKRKVYKRSGRKRTVKTKILKKNKSKSKKSKLSGQSDCKKLYMSKIFNKPIKCIIVEKIKSDEYMLTKEGDYYDENDYSNIIKEDTDCVYYEKNQLKVLFRYRKNVISSELSEIAYNSFNKYAQKLHDNRGAAAGALDRDKLPNYVGKLHNPGKFRSHYIGSLSKRLHKSVISNLAPSNIAGWYDKADRNIGQSKAPCRLTSFNRDHPDLWKNSEPFLKRISILFKELMPKEYKIQYKRANSTDFVIKNTAYSTITINHNWRTALHKDRGDLEEGFGNLVVVEDNSYTGGYIGFPQFGFKNNNKSICVDVKTGDFIAMDVHQWHCNTEIKPINKNKPVNRLSIVAYLRKNMLRCKGLKPEK